MTALPPALAAVIEQARPLDERFASADHRLFFVGGVVRDHLLGRARVENDLDLTTDAHPREIKTLVADLADAVWTQGERFGTIGCTIDGQIYEITTHRAESYDDGSRKPEVSFGDRIEDDLARRDFTVNAMAVDLRDGHLVDPHHGQDDLAAGVLRTPLDPEVSFSEDPLRMLRAARFRAGYDLAPTDELVAAMGALLDRIEIVSVERIRDELEKLLLLDDPAPGLRLLAATGLLARVLPALADLDPEAATRRGTEVASVVREPAARWAALLAPAGVTAAALGALRFSGSLSRDVVWLSSAADWIDEPGLRPAAPPRVRRDAALAPSDRDLSDLLDWVAALRSTHGLATDDLDRYRSVLGELRAAEPDLDDPTPLLTGEAVCAALGIEPGPQVGTAMRWLRELRYDEGPVDPAEASVRLREWWDAQGEPSS